MDKYVVVKRLTELPGEIEILENDVIEAQLKLTDAREALTEKESELLLSGTIDGKNAEARNAQIHQRTVEERGAVIAAECELSEARINLNRAANQFKAYRAIAYMISAEVA